MVVEGADLDIGGTINLTKGAGFFLAVTSGNINVDGNVSAGVGSAPALEGIYVIDGIFSTGTVTGTVVGFRTLTDSPLYVRGTVVAYGGIPVCNYG